MVLTLNQIVSRIRTLALSHKQINSFYFGALPEFDANGEIQYPACFLEMQPGSISKTERLQFFNFRLYLLDLVPESTNSEQNETDVLSDMASVLADMMAMLNYSDYQDDWIISPTANVVPVEEFLNDSDAGCYSDIQIGVDFLADRCQVPADDVTFETDIDMARTKIINYTASGLTDSPFTVSDIAGKIVLAAWRAGFYKRTVAVAPTDDEKIQITGTDLGNNKGILSTTGAVTLYSNDKLINGEKIDFLVYA